MHNFAGWLLTRIYVKEYNEYRKVEEGKFLDNITEYKTANNTMMKQCKHCKQQGWKACCNINDVECGNHINYYKIQYESGKFIIDSGKNALSMVKKYDLATRENIQTRLIQLEGEQLAIAISNNQE